MTISGFVAYVKQLWKNKPDRSTPITAERLLHMEEGIKGNSDAVEKIAAAVISQIINDPEKIASMAALFAVNEKVAKLNSDVPYTIKIISYYATNFTKEGELYYHDFLFDNDTNRIPFLFATSTDVTNFVHISFTGITSTGFRAWIDNPVTGMIISFLVLIPK